MLEPNLVSLSMSAFLAVLVVLSFLALAIRGLAIVFRVRTVPSAEPERRPEPTVPEDAVDAALVAALHAVIARQRPDTRILRIEETTARRAS